MRLLDKVDDLEFLRRRGISSFLSPIPDHAFFEQTQFERLFGDDLLEVLGLTAQALDLIRGRCTGRITGKPALAGLQELLRPTVIQALGDPGAPAKLRDAGLAPQAVQHDPDLLFGRILLSRRPADVPHNLLGRPVRCLGSLSHLRSSYGYDEPEILPSSSRRLCPMSADPGQHQPTVAHELPGQSTGREVGGRWQALPPSYGM